VTGAVIVGGAYIGPDDFDFGPAEFQRDYHRAEHCQRIDFDGDIGVTWPVADPGSAYCFRVSTGEPCEGEFWAGVARAAATGEI